MSLYLKKCSTVSHKHIQEACLGGACQVLSVGYAAACLPEVSLQPDSMILQVIGEVNRTASLVTDLRDSSKTRLRGVIHLSKVAELGKVRSHLHATSAYSRSLTHVGHCPRSPDGCACWTSNNVQAFRAGM